MEVDLSVFGVIDGTTLSVDLKWCRLLDEWAPSIGRALARDDWQ